MKAQIFVYVFIMWLMIIAGGGLLIAVIAPISINGFGKYSGFLDSGIKAAVAIFLVALWVFIMSKIKNWIFNKQIQN
ncbi:MAG: hypothetical protein KGH89_07245 [Thaumarchaeota archaeon]|nr:hypothetical protein [Nitrososphaerota archaeon]MDE1867619.1 hypothetical protein [Nitrososphaerota archaeon]